MRKLLLSLLLLPAFAMANTAVELDHAPINTRDMLSVQRGAKNFVNYCLTCHSANYMRYSRLQDLGLNEDQIRDNLILTGVKVGETMSIPLKPEDAKAWFGKLPPDLTVISRSRGVDWLYSYLRGFYRDDSKATGWNNTVFPQVAMPHVLYELQGQQVMVTEKNAHGERHKLHLVKPGQLSPIQYDQFVADLVNYLDYMGEPHKAKRIQTGIIVMFFLALLFPLAVLLKKEFWKDVK